MKLIRLYEISGEFCTRRNSPSLPHLRHLIEEEIVSGNQVQIDTSQVKILTPSFIDELIPPLIIKHGKELVDRLVTFSPPLTGYLKEQVERGTKSRGGK